MSLRSAAIRFAGRTPALTLASLALVRVSAAQSGLHGQVIAKGAGVGDAATRILALYSGCVRVEPHHYVGPEGHYLVVSAEGDSLAAIIFETDAKHVTMFRTSRRPAVEYMEDRA